MKNLVLALSVIAILLFAGCSGPQISAKEEAKNTTPPAQAEEEKKNIPPPAPPAVEEKNETVAPPEEKMADDACTIQFQKDPTGIYYLMVKEDSEKELFVRCPDSKLAEQRGSLYFCETVDTGEPAVAFLDLKECGRAYFDRASEEKKNAVSAIGCTVSLAPSRIVAGQTSVVTVWTSSGDRKITVDYNCGSKVESEPRSGMVSNSKICQFDTPGTIEVYANVDGELCANKLLEVFSTPRDCSVYGSKLEMVAGEYSYTAKVAGRGYSGGDSLTYKCYDVTYSRALRDAVPNPPDFVASIECRGKVPMTEPVKFKVGDTSCGSMELPAQP